MIKLYLLLSFVTATKAFDGLQPPVDMNGNPATIISESNNTFDAVAWYKEIKKNQEEEIKLLKEKELADKQKKHSSPTINLGKTEKILENESLPKATPQIEGLTPNSDPTFFPPMENTSFSKNVYVLNRTLEGNLKSDQTDGFYVTKYKTEAPHKESPPPGMPPDVSVAVASVFPPKNIVFTEGGNPNEVIKDTVNNINSVRNLTVKNIQEPCYGSMCTHVVLISSSLYFYHTINRF